jgi:hypoxanthine phosphoribosyltransferase
MQPFPGRCLFLEAELELSELISPERIRDRVKELGREIGQVYAGREICVVGLVKSSLVFMADLIREIPLDTTCHFMKTYSMHDPGAGGAPRTDIVFSAEFPYEDQDILLLDPVIDTGITLNFLLDHIRERKPRSLRVCALIDKPGERKIEVSPDWAAFTIKEPFPADPFIVGYGLDDNEHFRGLPYLGTIPRPVLSRRGTEASK